MTSTFRPIGEHLREWRQRRRLSQLDLAVEAEISTRHLSFLETGRARPSRDMVLRLAEQLDVPLRERNVLLVSAGYAPMFSERGLDDPALAAARHAIDLVLKGHEPFPALAVDRHWILRAANGALAPLLADLPADLLAPPVNVLRLSLHPHGLAPRIANYAEWRAHLLSRLHRQVEVTADPALMGLLEELRALPTPPQARASPHARAEDYGGVVVPLRLRVGDATLSLFSTTTVFGTPVDVTLSELAIEAFYPADAATAGMLRRLSAAAAGP
jgi:transcriptional regulator with XRE-family HTH domain